jgi:hypothetical protein
MEHEDYINTVKRVSDYAEKYFQEHEQTKFPSFLEVSRAVHVKYSDLMAMCDDGSNTLMSTGHNFHYPEDDGYPGMLTVEIL